MLKSFFLLFPITLLVAGSLLAQDGPKNPDFEDAQLGTGHLHGWFSPQKENMPDYEVQLVSDGAYKGKQCVELHSTRKPNGREFGNIMQSFDATPFRGKTVRFRGAVRVSSTGGGHAQMWMRVDRKDEEMGFFDNMGDRPITSSVWKEYEISGAIDTDAVDIYIGCMLIGEGKANFDAVSFDIITDKPAAVFEPPHPFEGKALQNLTAFAKLYGYVRFFHPTDAVANANWDNIAINGVKQIEHAKNPADLARNLQSFFRGVAPTLQVFLSGANVQIPKELLTPPSKDDRVIAWLHTGVGLAKENSIYHSVRTSPDDQKSRPPMGTYGGISQSVSAGELRGKSVTYSAYLHGKKSKKGNAELAISEYKNGAWLGKPIAQFLAETNDEWNLQTVSVIVPTDADSIMVSCRTYSASAFWIDDVSLVIANSASSANYLINPGFEDSFKGWQGSPTQFYSESPDNKLVRSGKYSINASLAGATAEMPEFPSVAKPELLDLAGGVSCLLPIALYSSQAAQATDHQSIDVLPENFIPGGNDRITRLADIIITWNVMQHFYPYFDVVETDWNEALRTGLSTAANDPGKREFEITLQQMMAKLHDGHGYVYGERYQKFAPFMATLADNKVAVYDLTGNYKGTLHRGDIIEEIDGHPVPYWYNRIDSVIPAGTKQSKDFRIYDNLFALVNKNEVAMKIVDSTGKEKTIMEKPTGTYPQFEENRPKNITGLKDGIMYVNLDKATKEEFTAHVEQLAKAKAIIFDMRGYPRGMLTEPISHIIDSAVTSARWNVPLVMYPNGENWKWNFSNWSVEPESPRFTKNIVHLTDGRAVSAAETYMGIIENYKIGEIVGNATAGTNGNVNPFTLPGKYSVMWTGMKVLKHDGSRHHGVGIHPTVPCTPTIKGIREGHDEVLEKGIEIAEKMIAKQK